MKLKNLKKIILIVFFVFHISSVYADDTSKKGFYFGINPGFSYYQSFTTPSSQNVGYGLGLRLGAHFDNRITVYGFADTMGYFLRSQDEFAASLDVGPAIKYNFSKKRDWFLTGGIGASFAVGGEDDTGGGLHSLFVSTGLGYDFKMGGKSIVSPELSFRFYTNQNENNPFSFGSNDVEQAIQAKIAVNFAWNF
jgi:hypothetical protein